MYNFHCYFKIYIFNAIVSITKITLIVTLNKVAEWRRHKKKSPFPCKIASYRFCCIPSSLE